MPGTAMFFCSGFQYTGGFYQHNAVFIHKMKILLDTCTFLWMLDEIGHLSPTAKSALEDGGNELVFHEASSWEIQIKYQLGKLPLARSPEATIQSGLDVYGIHYHQLNDESIWHLQKLPELHWDPFDRILISHALCTGHKLATPDPQIHKYPVSIL